MKPRVHQACLLAGSNIEPEKNLARGLELLGEQVQVLRRSSVWQSPSVGAEGPDYLNVAVLVRTPLSAARLKEEVLSTLEARLGRVRTEDKNAPRPMDLDIIVFDRQVLDPLLFQYAYRAVPVSELMPGLILNGNSLEKAALELAKSTPIRLKEDILAGS